MSKAVPILGIMVAIIGAVAFSWNINTTVENTTLTVVNKERLMSVSGTDGSSNTNYQNFVYTADESYIVEDSYWNWHFRSGTVYAKVPEDGGECDVKLVGIRMGFFSMYQNIIEIDCNVES